MKNGLCFEKKAYICMLKKVFWQEKRIIEN